MSASWRLNAWFSVLSRRRKLRTKFFWCGHGRGRGARSSFGAGTAVGGAHEVCLVRARRWVDGAKFVWRGHGGGRGARSSSGPGTAVGRPHEVFLVRTRPWFGLTKFVRRCLFGGRQVIPAGRPDLKGLKAMMARPVLTLDTPFADPDAESMRQKLNEFLLAARR